MTRVIAFSLQKWTRRQRKMIVAASTHHDLIEDLNLDIAIFKGFGDKAQIRYRGSRESTISILKDMRLEKASMDDYETLEEFHYLSVSMSRSRNKSSHIEVRRSASSYT